MHGNHKQIPIKMDFTGIILGIFKHKVKNQRDA